MRAIQTGGPECLVVLEVTDDVIDELGPSRATSCLGASQGIGDGVLQRMQKASVSQSERFCLLSGETPVQQHLQATVERETTTHQPSTRDIREEPSVNGI